MDYFSTANIIIFNDLSKQIVKKSCGGGVFLRLRGLSGNAPGAKGRGGGGWG